MNLIDKTANQSTFDRIFAMLNEEYYKSEEIEDKLQEVKDIMIDEYTPSKSFDHFSDQTFKSFREVNSRIERHTKDLEGKKEELGDMDRRIKAKTDVKETDRLWEESKRHPLNEDFTELYN